MQSTPPRIRLAPIWPRYLWANHIKALSTTVHRQLYWHYTTLQHSPVQHVLQDVDRHDDARLPATVQGEDGEVGRQHVGGLLSVCGRSCTAAAGRGSGRKVRMRSFTVSSHKRHLNPLPVNKQSSFNSVYLNILDHQSALKHEIYLLYIRGNVMYLWAHLVGHHFTGCGPCVGSQHHTILQPGGSEYT